jgi:hypothetical protein
VYLEHLERREFQQAFNCLTKRIKQLENSVPPVCSFLGFFLVFLLTFQVPQGEMRELCYLLSCASLKETPEFYDWDRNVGRQQLVEQLAALLQVCFYNKPKPIAC